MPLSDDDMASPRGRHGDAAAGARAGPRPGLTAIRARLAPEVDYGRLQLRLVEFRVDGMSDLSRSIGLEALMRGFLKMEIDKFNDDPELTTLPEPLQREGFELTDVRFTDEDGAPSLRADVVGPNDVYAVTRVFREMTKAEL